MSPSWNHTTVRSNGIDVHLVRIENRGPLVIFLHGFPECWYSWRQQLPAVAALGYRAWAPDLRGYNLSAKPRGIANYDRGHLVADVAGLIQAAGVDRAIVVGHDWGGIVAWWFAMDYPELLDKLIILNAPHPATFPGILKHPGQILRSWYVGFFQLPWLPEFVLSHNSRRFAEFIRQSAVRKQAFTDQDVQVYAEAMARPGALQAGINYYRALVRRRLGGLIKRIDAPTLLIWGEQDHALGKNLTYEIDRYVPNLRRVYIPNCGHWVQIEAADEVNRLLADFLGQAL